MIPAITPEIKEKLKSERLLQYQARIFQTEMDITAYRAVEDMERLESAREQLEKLIAAYEAVAVM